MRRLLFSTLVLLFSIHNFASTLVPGQSYRIGQAGKVLSVENSSRNNAANIVGWIDTQVNAQTWTLSVNETGQFLLTNAYTGQLLSYRGNMTNVTTGTNLCQKTVETAATTAQWLINPIEGQVGVYTLSPANNANLCINMASGSADGVSIFITTRQEGLATQQWTLEAVDAQPNQLNVAMRDLVMEGWVNQYYHAASGGHMLGGGGWWGDAEMFEVVLDAFETTGDAQYRVMFDELYRNFVLRNNTNWLYNAFNDDIAWMVLACVRAHLMFGTAEYLTRAQEIGRAHV